jgi:UDP-3-O-[3-hydroxymyristoyl] glucosamine N-acyltransferase
VILHAGCCVGVDGFGYATHKCEDGVTRHDKIPPVGNVVIDDDVELGASCAIQRATIGSSVIGAGTKFADLIGIGHGTKLGQHCLMVSQAGIAGSTTVGNYCVFGGQAGVVGHITIGDGVQVAAKAGVTNDVPAGVELLGQPAIPRAEARRIIMASMKLPEMRIQMKQLIKQVEQLSVKIENLEKGAE